MPKIPNDKYYTPKELAKHCIDILYSMKFDITEIIEPSAGNGSFSLQIENCIAYDLYPEHESIIEQDFLKLGLPYKKGRCFIGNPPFGVKNTLSVRFFNKCVSMGDYIAFKLPISQFENNGQMYKFDLAHSEVLPITEYTDRNLRCCFNIYKRPQNGLENKKDKLLLEDIGFGQYVRDKTKDDAKIIKEIGQFDFAMNTFGDVGREVFVLGKYCSEFYLTIKNEEIRLDVLNVMRNTDWKTMNPSISNSNLPMWRIIKRLKEMIPKLK